MLLGAPVPGRHSAPAHKEHQPMPDATPLVADPFTKFQDWLNEAWTHEPEDANAMTLASATPDGTPAARIVLLKDADARGFVFYTNTQSRKGEELTSNARAALLFHWKPLGRQVRIEGHVEHVTDAEADTYYATRPRISRLGAWASDQSRVLPDRAELERRLAVYEVKYPGEDIPRPSHWSGFRVVPERFEFWQNMPFRLHDRTIYTKAANGGWTIGKLFP
jgi:pyridoxamine 5'-phosphate oxidase